nr:immunoglobulin light chain junction region [Macaca mulatta]MOV69726.1 immunoglobulin light chain junction region [Macaca mulatta]
DYYCSSYAGCDTFVSF